MQNLAGRIRNLVKIWLLAAVVVIATLALAQDSTPASASSNTEILVSYSNETPTPVTSIGLATGAEPVVLYVWAKDVKGPLGAGGFQVGFEYTSSLVSVNSLSRAAGETWLGSTGRSAMCTNPVINEDPQTGAGDANVSCVTIGAPPQYDYGPTGTAVLAAITVQAGPTSGTTTLNLTPGGYGLRTYLYDTGAFLVPPAEIPATVRSVQITIALCGDVNDDGAVSTTDVFLVAQNFGLEEGYPGWNPTYDLNEDDAVSTVDTFLAAAQFGLECYQ